MNRPATIRAVLGPAILLLFVVVPDLQAQAAELGRQSLRPYWHVFIAYALVIVIIGAWALSIGRRMSDLEKRLVD
jgi:CcmD family protein